MAALRIQHLAVLGDGLAIAWSDGHEQFLQLADLRRACPCANCQGEPDALGRVLRPQVSFGEKSFQLASWEVVGGYAIQPRWADGHATGIYSFQYLRELG